MMEREYKSLTILYDGNVLYLDGLRLVKDEGEIKVGDLYIAERNTGPKLLTAKEIVPFNSPDHSGYGGWIIPTNHLEYSYDLHECVKVKEVEDQE